MLKNNKLNERAANRDKIIEENKKWLIKQVEGRETFNEEFRKIDAQLEKIKTALFLMEQESDIIISSKLSSEEQLVKMRNAVNENIADIRKLVLDIDLWVIRDGINQQSGGLTRFCELLGIQEG